MIRTSRRMQICVTLLVCNLVFIWGNSMLPGEISGKISDWLKNLLASILPDSGAEDPSGGFLLRKLAHFTEFTALGVLLSWLFGMLGKKRGYPFLFGTAAACMDETIQMFVPDRGPAIRDVCIDSCGVLTGMLLLCFGHTWYQKYRNKSLEDN